MLRDKMVEIMITFPKKNRRLSLASVVPQFLMATFQNGICKNKSLDLLCCLVHPFSVTN
jgi:hypothetical protein